MNATQNNQAAKMDALAALNTIRHEAGFAGRDWAWAAMHSMQQIQSETAYTQRLVKRIRESYERPQQKQA